MRRERRVVVEALPFADRCREIGPGQHPVKRAPQALVCRRFGVPDFTDRFVAARYVAE
jgi:hypothetical protein